jgi:hypothetical protein
MERVSDDRYGVSRTSVLTCCVARNPVGDPLEMQSLQSTFSGPERNEELFVGSVKDNTGHAEAASGAAGVIKLSL